MSFSLLSNRDEFGYPLKFDTASAAGLVQLPKPDTSYENPLGTGNRSEDITVTQEGGWLRGDPLNLMINGVINAYMGFNAVSAAGCSATFDLGAPRFISEMKLYLWQSYDIGTWQWYGSNDNTTWSNAISDAVNCVNPAGTPPMIFPMAEKHNKKYRYYKMVGVSGVVDGSGYFQQLEFKIDAVV